MKNAKASANEKKTAFLSVVVTPAEKKKLQDAAARDGRKVSDWLRRTALKQADSK